MDNKKYFIKVRKITIIVLTASITSILLYSFIPLIADTITADSPDFERLIPVDIQEGVVNDDEILTFTELYTYYSLQERVNNYEEYGLSENQQLGRLADQTNLIYYCFWIIFLISLISYIGLTLNAAEIYPKITQIMILFGCIIILFNFLVIFLHIQFLDLINNYESISLAYIISPAIPITYFHILIVFNILCLISSIAYTVYVLPKFIKQKTMKKQPKALGDILLNSKEEKKQELMQNPLTVEKPLTRQKATFADIDKYEDIKEKWIREQQIKQNVRKTYATSELKSTFNSSFEDYEHIQKIPPKSSIGKSTHDFENDYSENIEEKKSVDYQNSFNKKEPSVKSLFEETDEKYSEPKKLERPEKVIPPSKKYIAEPFKTKKEIYTPPLSDIKKDEPSKQSEKNFEKTLFSAIDKRKKEIKKKK